METSSSLEMAESDPHKVKAPAAATNGPSGEERSKHSGDCITSAIGMGGRVHRRDSLIHLVLGSAVRGLVLEALPGTPTAPEEDDAHAHAHMMPQERFFSTTIDIVIVIFFVTH
jgi:hypothetical protein